MSERPITPVTITLMDQQEREFLLSMGGIKRLKKRFGAKVISDLLNHDAEEAGVAILYEALLEKGEMTEDQFAELLPAHLEDTVKAVLRLLGASIPEQKDRPTETPPATIR